jgi:hypothetical protein
MSRLEQTGTESPVYAHHEADNPVGEFVAGGILGFNAGEFAFGRVDDPLIDAQALCCWQEESKQARI